MWWVVPTTHDAPSEQTHDGSSPGEVAREDAGRLCSGLSYGAMVPCEAHIRKVCVDE